MSDNNKNANLGDLDWGLGKVVWAKTNMKDPDDLRWSSLAQHSIDTAWVAGKVWDEFLPDAVKNRISEGFNGDKGITHGRGFESGGAGWGGWLKVCITHGRGFESV